GWRPGSTATPVPTFSRAVRDSAYAMPANGSTTEPNTISGSHSESTPSSSTRSTASPNTAGTPAGPSEIPILTFMPPSDHEPARAWARHQDRRPAALGLAAPTPTTSDALGCGQSAEPCSGRPRPWLSQLGVPGG